MIDIRKMRQYLITKIGAYIVIIYYGSRNRIERYEGVVFRIYNNVFLIKLLNGDTKSFSYNDILTKTIRIYI